MSKSFLSCWASLSWSFGQKEKVFVCLCLLAFLNASFSSSKSRMYEAKENPGNLPLCNSLGPKVLSQPTCFSPPFRIFFYLFFCFVLFLMKASFFLYFLISFWLCWVFVSVRGLSLVAASGGHSSSRCMGLSLSWPLLLRSTSSRRAGSVIVAHGPSCSTACGIFPDQGSNLCPLHWQADSQPPRHQGSPFYLFYIKHSEFLVVLSGRNREKYIYSRSRKVSLCYFCNFL